MAEAGEPGSSWGRELIAKYHVQYLAHRELQRVPPLMNCDAYKRKRGGPDEARLDFAEIRARLANAERKHWRGLEEIAETDGVPGISAARISARAARSGGTISAAGIL